MGFPVGYSEVLLPKLLLNTLWILGFIRKFIQSLFQLLGLSDYLEPDIAWPERPLPMCEPRSVSASLIREMLPVVKFSEVIAASASAGGGGVDLPECCAVCLYDFEGDEEIRRLTNCRHIFHRSCLDRWMDHDQKTCPLCRTQFIPDDMQDVFNERLWAASGVPDFYGDFYPITHL